jgi:hypothetical protein
MYVYLRLALWNAIRTLAPGVIFMLVIEHWRDVFTTICRGLPSREEDMKDLMFFYVSQSHRARMRAGLNRFVAEALHQVMEEGMAHFMTRFGNLNSSEFWTGDRSRTREIET